MLSKSIIFYIVIENKHAILKVMYLRRGIFGCVHLELEICRGLQKCTVEKRTLFKTYYDSV